MISCRKRRRVARCSCREVAAARYPCSRVSFIVTNKALFLHYALHRTHLFSHRNPTKELPLSERILHTMKPLINTDEDTISLAHRHTKDNAVLQGNQVMQKPGQAG